MRVGTVGRLRVALDDTEYADDVRVARCAPGKGTTCELGLELLWVPKAKEPRERCAVTGVDAERLRRRPGVGAAAANGNVRFAAWAAKA